MSRRCPRCNSHSVRHDRSLAGRAVCGGCGMVLGPNDPRQARRSTAFKTTYGFSFRNPVSAIAWLIPASLLGAYLYLWANPRVIPARVAPNSESARNSWNIATPADIELLIGKAQEGFEVSTSQRSENAIRSIAINLISKGVRVLISDNVMPHAAGEWDPGRGELRIRPSIISMGSATLAEVLAHEAAHVAQSCRAGGINRKSEPMGIQVDPAKTYQQQLNSILYKGPISDKAIELEAFSVGAIPEWAPRLLDHFCK
jgi:hypothetical protein